MVKGKLYEELVNEVTERDGYSKDFKELLDEAKREFPLKPKSFRNKDDLIDYGIAVHGWYAKWLGDEE